MMISIIVDGSKLVSETRSGKHGIVGFPWYQSGDTFFNDSESRHYPERTSVCASFSVNLGVDGLASRCRELGLRDDDTFSVRVSVTVLPANPARPSLSLLPSPVGT